MSYNENYLAHYGVLGMKWGRRQNRDRAKRQYKKVKSQLDLDAKRSREEAVNRADFKNRIDGNKFHRLFNKENYKYNKVSADQRSYMLYYLSKYGSVANMPQKELNKARRKLEIGERKKEAIFNKYGKLMRKRYERSMNSKRNRKTRPEDWRDAKRYNEWIKANNRGPENGYSHRRYETEDYY